MFSFFGGEVPPRPFDTFYRCYSVSMLPGTERNELEWGGKIILPASALDQLTRLNIVYPMLFKLTNNASSRSTHCGVLEFVADEGKVYLPYWMMQNLTLEEGGLLRVQSASLPVATFSRFQPHSVDFLDLSNPKAVLEARLRNFACLSTGDVIAIQYNDKTYEMSVLETKPAEAVSIIECDMNVDFAPPVGYKEPERPKNKSGHEGGMEDDDEADAMDVADLMPEPTGFVAFGGSGVRLDGKKKKTVSESSDAGASGSAAPRQPEREYVPGIPDYDYEIGSIKFIRSKPRKPGGVNSNGVNNEEFEAFKGAGIPLRSSAKDSKDRK